jgi:hypothetical protein
MSTDIPQSLKIKYFVSPISYKISEAFISKSDIPEIK